MKLILERIYKVKFKIDPIKEDTCEVPFFIFNLE